jgi:hypothetical protein
MDSNSDITELLEMWQCTKQEISKLEERCEKFKHLASKYMNKTDSDILESSELMLRRKNITRSTLNKKNVPKTLWDQYSKPTSYQVFYLTKNK